MKIGPRRIRSLTQPLLIHGFLILVALTCVFPLAWMVSSALKTQQTVFSDFSMVPDHPNWQNFSIAWIKGDFRTYFFNSVLYTVSVVLGVTLVSSLAAYGFARLRFPGRTALYFIFLAAMMVPLPGSFVPLYVMLVKLGLDDTRLGYILALINTGLSLSIYMLKVHFDQMPKELEDAARMDGCSKLRLWWHVALPLAKPVVSVVVIINALNVWNEYLLAMVIFTSRTLMPLQRGLMVFEGTHLTQYPLLMAGMTISVVPAILGYLLMQKYIVRGVTAGALVG